jgi:hypothetical protein
MVQMKAMGEYPCLNLYMNPTDQTSSEVLEQKEKVAILKDLIKDLPYSAETDTHALLL